MSTHVSSPFRLTRYTLTVAVIAMVAVAGSVWANGKGQSAGATPGDTRINVSALLSKADIARLPVLNVDHPF